MGAKRTKAENWKGRGGGNEKMEKMDTREGEGWRVRSGEGKENKGPGKQLSLCALRSCGTNGHMFWSPEHSSWGKN